MVLHSSKGNGFTLIELLIYIVIIGGVTVTFLSYSLSVAQSRNKTYVVQEVQANARVAMEIISQRIRAASAVTSPINGNAGSSLTLVMSDPNKNPTIIDENANGALQMKEGASGAYVPITSSRVKVTNLVFTNLSGNSPRENIRIELTLAYDNSAGDVEYNYSQSLQTTVSVRQ